MTAGAWWAACLSLSLSLSVGASGELIDQVMAVVDKTVVTQSELFTEARIALVAREGARGIRLLEGSLDRELMASMRSYVVNQILIANQVRRLGVVEVEERQVDHALERFVARFPSDEAYEAFLRKYDIPVSVLRDILRRDLRNEAYINERMRAWAVGAKGADRAVRAKAALERWLGDLRSSSEIRLLGPAGELELQ